MRLPVRQWVAVRVAMWLPRGLQMRQPAEVRPGLAAAGLPPARRGPRPRWQARGAPRWAAALAPAAPVRADAGGAAQPRLARRLPGEQPPQARLPVSRPRL